MLSPSYVCTCTNSSTLNPTCRYKVSSVHSTPTSHLSILSVCHLRFEHSCHILSSVFSLPHPPCSHIRLRHLSHKWPTTCTERSSSAFCHGSGASTSQSGLERGGRLGAVASRSRLCRWQFTSGTSQAGQGHCWFIFCICCTRSPSSLTRGPTHSNT